MDIETLAIAATIVGILSPPITALTAFIVRGVAMRVIDRKIEKLCRQFTDPETGYVPRVTFESRLAAFEAMNRSPEVMDKLQALYGSFTLLERRFDAFLAQQERHDEFMQRRERHPQE